MLFNLRSDPFERAQHESGDYVRWFIEHAFVIVPAQGIVGQHLAELPAVSATTTARFISQSSRQWRNSGLLPRTTNPHCPQIQKEPMTKSTAQFLRLDRRAPLSSLAMLPVLPASLRSTAAVAAAASAIRSLTMLRASYPLGQ